MTLRWINRPEGSNWGDFGVDDQLGRLNLLTPAKVLEGIAEVRSGLSFCLSLPLDIPGRAVNPRRQPPQLSATKRDGKPQINFPLDRLDARSCDIMCDDQVQLCLQYSTQWDALAHVGARFDADGDGVAEMVYYNGYRAGEHIRGAIDYERGDASCGGPFGAHALGIEKIAETGVQGRGVLVDLHAHFGSAREMVGYDSLMRIMEIDGVVVETGDMLLLRTGYSEMMRDMGDQTDAEVLRVSCAVLDGSDRHLLNWITDSGLAALISDNDAVEAYPARAVPESQSLLPLHHHCLFKLGLPLGELWWLKDLATWLHAHGRSRFLLTAPPLRLPGAVGSPVTPVATV
jgi:kynurenine formamidase